LANRWRIRPRFTLWALLVLITVIAIPLAYVTQRRSWNLKRAAACERLQNHGTMISMIPAPKPIVDLGGFADRWSSLLEEFATSQLISITICCDPGDPSDPIGNSEFLRLLGYFPEVEELVIEDCRFTDQELKELWCLKELRTLEIIGGDQVCGDFLNRFPSSCKLEAICFGGLSKLSADKLRPLTRMRSLKEVQFWRCEGITKESIRNIGLPRTVNVIVEP
jgi:hypothetical protein